MQPHAARYSHNAAVYSALELIHGRPTGRTGKQSNSVIAAEWTLDIRQQLDGVFTSIRPNVGRQPIIAGKWFRYEILMELNSVVSTNVSDRGKTREDRLLVDVYIAGAGRP